MTIPEYWTDDETDNYPADVEGTAQTDQNFPVVPVKVIFDENQRLSPTFCSCMTWPIAVVGVNTPLLILPRKETRFKAKFIVNFPAAGTLYVNTKSDPLSNPSPQGFTLTVTAAGNSLLPDYDAMQPMYAIASIAGVTISVWDESYGAVAS